MFKFHLLFCWVEGWNPTNVLQDFVGFLLSMGYVPKSIFINFWKNINNETVLQSAQQFRWYIFRIELRSSSVRVPFEFRSFSVHPPLILRSISVRESKNERRMIGEWTKDKGRIKGNVLTTKSNILASRFILNINYHQCPLIVPLILFMSISKEKINVSKLMSPN